MAGSRMGEVLGGIVIRDIGWDVRIAKGEGSDHFRVLQFLDAASNMEDSLFQHFSLGRPHPRIFTILEGPV